MRCFKRGLWLLAWGTWAWLGVGLYRELPRTLGPPIATLPSSRDWPLGFLPGSSDFVMFHHNGAAPAAVLIYDARSGTLRRRIEGPPARLFFPDDDQGERMLHQVRLGVRRFGLVLTNAAPGGGEESQGLHALDLVSARWRRLAKEPVRYAATHDARPWVLFAERVSPGYPTFRLRVVDARSRAERFSQLSPILNTHIVGAFFAPGADRLVIALRTANNPLDRQAPASLVFWTLGDTPRLERMIASAHLGQSRPIAAPSGRVLFGDPWPEDPSMDVTDLADGALLASFPGRNANDNGPAAFACPPCAIANDGKTILGGKPAILWEVDTKRLLWRGREREQAYPDVERGDFAVLERWTLKLRRSLRLSGGIDKYATVAWHSLQTGELLRRTWAEQFIPPGLVSEDGALGVTTDGVVYSASAYLDRPLLALCQAILSLPLVLLWTVLWWRRRRRASGAASARRVS